ncbi:MAG: hypothetical protein EHM64_09095 [Ignavibacteriae bacterium]|nr:MAG: hypothetical protein EHM64_09095 [Ignavibacteriota bacterium]
MGRSAILLVSGLALMFGVFTISMNKSFESLSSSEVGYYNYSYARNIARTAIHRTLREYDKATPTIPTTGTFDGGAYTIGISVSGATGDTMLITSVGTYPDNSSEELKSHYTMHVKLLRTTKPFPSSKSAIGIRAVPVTYNISGSPQVDGRNYDATGTTLVGSGDLPGVTTMNPVDSAQVANAGGANIIGSPAVKVDTSVVDPKDFIDEYKANADYKYPSSGTFSGATWGSPTSPVITYCNAGDNPDFSIKFTGGVVGYGILVVRGDVQFNGNLEFYGLVIVDGFNTTVTFGASGTPKIVGGVIVAGNAGAKVTLKGTGSNAKIRYSSEALARARNIGKLRYYSIMDWYE